VPSFGPVIEQGVEVIGSYIVTMQIAIEGYGSVDELRADLSTTLDAVAAAADNLRIMADRREEGERLAEFPVTH
jgi:hypothetical protein